MPCKLKDLLRRLKDAIDAQGDPERIAALENALSGEQPIIPLVHRTGDPAKGNALESIFMEGCLRPPKQPNKGEKDFGLGSSVYFSHGVGAYPRGNAAFVFSSKIAKRRNSAFTPFDTGALLKTPFYLEPVVSNPNWNDVEVRRKFLEEHTGHGRDLDKFARHYLKAHFRNAADYITQSSPDWPAYHGLRSANGDRRAWAIETRIPHPIFIKHAQAIFLDSELLLRQVEDKYAKLVIIRVNPSADLREEIAKFVLEKMLTPQRVKLFRRLVEAMKKMLG